MDIVKHIWPVVGGVITGIMLITVGETKMTGDYLGATIPDDVYIKLLGLYIVCAYCAGLIASVISGRMTSIPVIAVGIALTLAGLYNMMHIPHPGWFMAGNMIAYLPFTYLGFLTLRKKHLVS